MILLFFSVLISEAMLSTYLSSTLDPNGSLSRARKLLPANLLFITSHCKCLLGKNYLFLVFFFLQNLCKTNKPNKKTLLSIFFKVQARKFIFQVVNLFARATELFALSIPPSQSCVWPAEIFG